MISLFLNFQVIILAVIVSAASAFTQSENGLSGEFAKSQPKKSGDIFSLLKVSFIQLLKKQFEYLLLKTTY